MNLTKPQKLIYDMEKFAGGAISVICGSMLLDGKMSPFELKRVVNEIYRINDALRIRIDEINGEVFQSIIPYTERDIEVLCFNNKVELDCYAEDYAHLPLDFYGNLCDTKIIILPNHYGILVKLHHIIGDAWTLSLLGTQFNAFINGETPTVFSYTDYVNDEVKYLQSKRYKKDKSFFLEQFKKCDEVTYISEKQNNSLISKRKTFVIDSEKTNQIISYAQQNNTSAFMLFTAALSVYINRTKMNAEKFYVGTAVINRSNMKERNTAGMFINTVPMLIELETKKTFCDNLLRVEDSAFSLFRHQKFNYSDVLTSIRKEYGVDEKLYDVIISYQNASVTGADIETTWYHSGMQSESLQIHIDDRDNEGVFRIHYDYQTEKFTEHDIDMLHLHICTLLFDALEDDTKKLYELEILIPEERQKLLYDFNDTAMNYPKDKCIHQLFEEQAERTPGKTAVVACDKTLTYRELNEEANRIAHSLIEKGIGVGDIVAVILPRESNLISALFGVLKTGAAYMPLDPSYPKDRISYLINESGSTLVIDKNNIKIFLSSEKTNNPCVSVSTDDLFCALHTSGSTGKPKVTALTQQNLLNFLYSNEDFWRNVNSVISVTIATFDIFMQDSLLSAVFGKKIILASNEQIFNQFEFERMFEDEENIMFFSTPTKLLSYIKQSKTADFLKKIRTLIVGGEVFTDELYDLIIEKIGAGTMYNGYGPSETTLGVSFTEPLPPKKNLEMFNCYGPCETSLWVTKLYMFC